MDIVAINEAITDLEGGDTTQENVEELAALYVVRNNLQSTEDKTRSELQDIFPYYTKYKEIKKRYQMNQTIEYELSKAMKDVCKEIEEFIISLYSGTSMHKERMCIKKMLKELSERYHD